MCLEDRPVLEPNAAGIDVGAREMFVAVPPGRDENPVRVFATFTEDLERLTDWLERCGVTTVALESTGVYWIPLSSNWGNMDQVDNDFGSAGALLIPPQEGSTPDLIAAAGKDGRMFILNRNGMGGYTPGGPDKVLTQANIGGCWCGQSYFHHKIVSSGGSNVILWRIKTSPSISLQNEGTSAGIGGAQFPGFFTSISSDEDDHPIIWAVSRPNNPTPADISLFAFRGEPSGSGTLDTLFQSPAGTWPNTGGDANIVPTVVNGKVYVASYKQLSIFGMH